MYEGKQLFGFMQDRIKETGGIHGLHCFLWLQER
jgi:hypothetical protein